MIQLEDLLGSLLTQIGEARLQADQASLELAERYAESDLLKYLPVPRVKLPTIDITLPVLIDEASTTTNYDSAIGIDKRSLVNSTYSILKDKLILQYPTKNISRSEYVGLTRSLFNLADELENDLNANNIDDAKNQFILKSINELVTKKSIKRATRTPIISKEIKTELSELLNKTLPGTRNNGLKIDALSNHIR